MTRFRSIAVVSLTLAVLALPGAAGATGTITTRASVSSTGEQADRESYSPWIAADGRYVVFVGTAKNLVPGDTNHAQDIFLRDRSAHTTSRVDVSTSGAQANGGAFWPAVSGDGRYVAFTSDATNLVPGTSEPDLVSEVYLRDRTAHTTVQASLSPGGDPADGSSWPLGISADGRDVLISSWAKNLVEGDANNKRDVFVRDMVRGTTTLVSVSTSGEQANAESISRAISAHGRYVAFESSASNLVPNDTNHASDVFVRDLVGRTTIRVSVSGSGAQGNGPSRSPAISADGRYVAFASDASDLVPGDTNHATDIFIRDLVAHTTVRVSLAGAGAQGNGGSRLPSISASGRFVAFISTASDLVPGDTNHVSDVFVRDRTNQTTTRCSVSTAGVQGNGVTSSQDATGISADGRSVMFVSSASNLVANDTNRSEDVFVRGPPP